MSCSKRRLIMLATRIMGLSRERQTQPYHCLKNFLAWFGYCLDQNQRKFSLTAQVVFLECVHALKTTVRSRRENQGVH